MIMMFGILCLAFCWMEWKLFGSRPAARHWLEHHSTAALVGSTALSWVLGTVIFGAEGIIVMMAGLVSTMIMNQVWRNYSTVETTSVRAAARYKVAKENYQLHKEQYKHNVEVTLRAMKLVWAITIFPFKVIFGIIDSMQRGVDAAKAKLHR